MWANRKIEGRSTWLCVLFFHCFKTSEHMCCRREAPQGGQHWGVVWCLEAQLSGDIWGGLSCRSGRKEDNCLWNCLNTHLLLGLALQMQLLGMNVSYSSALLGAVGHLSSQALPGWGFLYPPCFLIASGSSWFRERHENIVGAFPNLKSER